MNKKISTPWGIVILLVIVLAFVGGLSVVSQCWEKVNSGTIPVLSPAPTPADETAGWKIYESDIYDYEIKYPSEYKTSKQEISTGVSDIEETNYADKDYFYSFEVFARDNDFIVRDCLKNLAGEDITKTIDVNGNKFYIFEEKTRGVGGYMSLVLGGMRSEYHIIHNNQCYIVTYSVVPTDDNSPLPSQTTLSSKFGELDQIFSTFKFTNSVSNPSIIVTSPNGGEAWKVGGKYNITWTTGRYSVATPILIELVDITKGGGARVTIHVADKVSNTGNYSWTIPSTLGGMAIGGGNSYKIVVSAPYDHTLNYSDFSNDNFTIVSK